MSNEMPNSGKSRANESGEGQGLEKMGGEFGGSGAGRGGTESKKES